jgi:nucleoside-diphosphate-sugar epimerase
MQTILGAGGAIGTELAKSLSLYTSDIRLVARNPQKVNETDKVFRADLTKREEVLGAVANSSVVYLTAGLPYNTKTWQELWPLITQNVIDACSAHRTRLVFFDNVYAIGGDEVKHITEESPVSPVSKKGEIRARVDRKIQEAAEQGSLQAIIARSPDFFGPIKATSVLMSLVYDNLKKGRTALWFCNARVLHSFGYTRELAKGTAMLGNTVSAYNQIWNLPTAKPITGKEWVSLFADEMKLARKKCMVLPGWAIGAMGLFVPVLKELYEMRYQYDRDYVFDSAKFEREFKYQPISNAAAVRETLAELEK